MRKTIKLLIFAIVIFLIGAQFYRPARTNPPINPASTFEAVAHPSPELAAMVKRACYDCHSNTTTWPWYSQVAPASWLVADDVVEGRAHLNFSEWGFLSPEMARMKLQTACREVKSGGMPLWQYKLIHRDVQPSEQEIALLCSEAEKGK